MDNKKNYLLPYSPLNTHTETINALSIAFTQCVDARNVAI